MVMTSTKSHKGALILFIVCFSLISFAEEVLAKYSLDYLARQYSSSGATSWHALVQDSRVVDSSDPSCIYSTIQGNWTPSDTHTESLTLNVDGERNQGGEDPQSGFKVIYRGWDYTKVVVQTKTWGNHGQVVLDRVDTFQRESETSISINGVSHSIDVGSGYLIEMKMWNPGDEGLGYSYLTLMNVSSTYFDVEQAVWEDDEEYDSAYAKIDSYIRLVQVPALSVSPTSLDFGTTGVSLTITVKNTGGGTLNWNASESLDWVSLNKTSGSLGAGISEDVTATVSRTGKSPGTYNGTISFTSNGGSQNVSVTMTVPQATPDPVLSVNPTSLDFGTTGVSLTITVRNNGGGTLNWNASESLDWLGLSKISGSLGAGSSENVAATVSRTGKSPGTYNGTISFTSNGGSQNVSVSMTVAGATPTLSVSPTSLDFGTTGVSLTITVKNTGGGTLDWNASESLDWVSLNKTSGSLGGGISEDVTATVSRTGKSPGTYNGTISFTSNGGSQNVSVTMTVPGATPALSVSPTSLDFGTTGVSLTITVKNTGGGTLDWNASESLDWLGLSKTSGSLGAGSSENVTATVSRTGKSPGSYNGTISFTSNGGSQNVSVSMTVPQSTPDPVLSVSPTSLDFGTTGVNLTVTVRNSGGGTLSWNASENIEWLSLSKTSGSLGGGSSENVTATVSRTGKSPGSYSGTMSFTSIVGGSQNVSVSMTVPEPAPALSVNPTSHDFGTSETSYQFTVRNSGGGTLDWSTSENLDWLSLNKTSGSLGAGSSENVTATVSRAGKSPGTYNGTISFTSSYGNQNVSVSMTVPQPDPALSVSPTSLDFGTTGVSLTITVKNTGGGTLNWNASENIDWLSLNKTSGSLGAGSSENVTATVSRTGKSQGTYNGTISFTSSYGNQNVSVSMTVPDTTPPIISNLRVNPTIAKAGVDLTITFTVSETLQSNPLVTVAGNAAAISGKVGNDYAYLYRVQGIEGQGIKPVNVSAADSAGNIGSANTTVALDFTEPKCEADKWGVWHATDVIITLTATDEEKDASGIAIARYNWDTEASETVGTEYNNGDTITLSTETGENGKELHLYARDNAGNWQIWNKTYYLDKTGPICSADKSDVWHRQDITITLICSAGTGDIAKANYNWDTPASDTVGTRYFNGDRITLDREVNGRTLYLYVKSTLGREKTWSGKYYLDKTDPSCSADKSGTWHREDIAIILVATDVVSGIAVARYKWDTPASETEGVVYSDGSTFTLTTEVNGRTLYLYVKDNAGREKTWNGTYYLDKTPPSNCLISINGGDEYTNTISATLTLSASDSGSGVSKMQFSSDGVKWSSEEDYATSRSWMLTEGDEEKRVYVQYKDNVGNWSAVTSDTIILDTISPIVKLLVDKARILPDGEIVGVIPDTGMEARFSKMMDGISVSEGLKLVAVRDNLNRAINEKVSLDFEWDVSTKTARMNPKTGELKKNYLYRLQVTDKVRDLAGNTVKGERELIFRTIMDHTKKNVVVKATDERLMVTLEANALKEDGYLIINTEPLIYQFEINSEVINLANEKSMTNRWYPIEGCLWEIKACNKNGNWIRDNFGSEVKITFPYDEKGVVGNTAIPLSEETLMAFWLNEENSNWVKMPGSRVDRENNLVITGEVPNFSVFSLMGTALYDLRDAYAYPVPWKPNDGKDETGTEEGGITFTRLFTEAVIRIYTISGELVKEYEYRPAYRGEWKWDVKTSNGEKVFSGVYIYHIESEKERKTGKLVIIR